MKIYFRGTKIELIDNTDNQNERRLFILAETFERDYVFQMIIIEGYHAGQCLGYIKVELGLGQKVSGVTYTHLLSELKRNIIFDENSLRILE